MTRPKPPAPPARTPETASSTTTERAGVVPHRAACTKVSGAGLPASPSSRGDPAVDDRHEAVGQPAGLQHRGAFADDETTASGIPWSRSTSRSATEPG